MIEIKLTQNQIAIVDDIDADLDELNWFADFSPSYTNGGNYQAKRNTYTSEGTPTTERMHRVILSRMLGRKLGVKELVDHRNLNPLDNRRENLRLANHTQNSQNQSKRISNSSGYKGVHFNRDGNKWRARIQLNGERILLGDFKTAEQAAQAYDIKARELFGEFALTNF